MRIVALVITACAAPFLMAQTPVPANSPFTSTEDFARYAAELRSKALAVGPAEAYMKKHFPDVELSEEKPTVELVENSPEHGGPVAAVHFVAKPSKNPFTRYTVWVRPDGKVAGVAARTP